MVRSHKKQKTSKSTAEADLDRFAGSSEEEEEEVDEKQNINNNINNNDDDDDESTDQEKEYAPRSDTAKQSLGMAGAMARILGGASSNATTTTTRRSVVLSKTMTPLQRQLQKEHLEKKQKDKKRKLNRQRNLQALHVPLSVATTANVDLSSNNNSSHGLVQELQQERLHRRVATRGVVALFNAIAQHQQQQHQPQQQDTLDLETTNNNNNAPRGKLTKHGFLDMIKTKAAATKTTSPQEQQEQHSSSLSSTPKTTTTTRTKKWNAFSDDFMMNSKLKDWDKESSCESDKNDNNNDDDDWSSDDNNDNTDM